ncbi:MAG: hypothetical protein HETSPECPRED_005150 [Heterodermia speciosa]|uniref:Uncharacterized protein n=1 Tax=Heterodermia speciosa TaxID=116794 RepID=A0A8H3FHD8_9LECA|nr:MAG: hypothetical protein HETSPECPRED_005150 [Heterodermia speciosa]
MPCTRQSYFVRDTPSPRLDLFGRANGTIMIGILLEDRPSSNGLATGDEACSFSGFSACCGAAHQCLRSTTAAVCNHGAEWHTGSCTDQSWLSDACPKYCGNGEQKTNLNVVKLSRQNVNEERKGTEAALTKCATDGTFEFCCKNDETCDCTTGIGTFRLSNDSAVASPSGTAGLSPSTTTSLPSTSPTTSSSPTSSAAPKSSNSHNIAIGAGIGIPLGLIALSVIGFLLYRDRRNKQLIREMRHNNGGLTGMGNGIEEPNGNGIEKNPVYIDESESKGRG